MISGDLRKTIKDPYKAIPYVTVCSNYARFASIIFTALEYKEELGIVSLADITLEKMGVHTMYTIDTVNDTIATIEEFLDIPGDSQKLLQVLMIFVRVSKRLL